MQSGVLSYSELEVRALRDRDDTYQDMLSFCIVDKSLIM